MLIIIANLLKFLLKVEPFFQENIRIFKIDFFDEKHDA